MINKINEEKKRRYWLRGGAIGLIVSIIFTYLIKIPFLYLRCGESCNTLGYMMLINSIISSIIGALLGWIYGKIKERKMK